MAGGTEVRTIFFKLGSTLQQVKPAPVLTDDTAELSCFFRNLLRKNEQGFECTVRLEGFPGVQMRFRAACQTAALVSFDSYHPARPPTRAILDVLANVYFKMFGTNEITDEP